jgi:hypothetical protein
MRSKVTHFFIGFNVFTYVLSRNDKDSVEKYFYDPWDKFKFIFEDKDQSHSLSEKSLEFLKNMGKIAFTINYPKNQNELAASTGLLWLFSRPLELMLGSKVIAYTFLTSQMFTFLCFLPSPYNTIKNSFDNNLYSMSFSGATALLFCFTGATRSFRFLAPLSYIPLILFLGNPFPESYEVRPAMLTALMMCLYIRWKVRVY